MESVQGTLYNAFAIARREKIRLAASAKYSRANPAEMQHILNMTQTIKFHLVYERKND